MSEYTVHALAAAPPTEVKGDELVDAVAKAVCGFVNTLAGANALSRVNMIKQEHLDKHHPDGEYVLVSFKKISRSDVVEMVAAEQPQHEHVKGADLGN